MFVHVLPARAQSNLATIAGTPLASLFYLAGGTAVVLHLGHRLSYDLDFFTLQPFPPDLPRRTLSPLGQLKIDQESEGTFLGIFNDLRVSFFIYHYPLLETPAWCEGIQVAGLADLAAMKLDAISSRGKKRDFVDLHHICQRAFPLAQAIAFFEQRYKGVQYSKVHLFKSLVYFADAEEDAPPKMLVPFDWAETKQFFEDEVQRLMREL